MRLFFTTKIIIEMQENYWHAVAFPFCETFKRAINRPKSDPRLFFFPELSHQCTSFYHFWKKITDFFSIVQGSASEKMYKFLSIRGFTLLIRANNYETAATYIYESAVSITSLLKTISDPLKEIWSKQT